MVSSNTPKSTICVGVEARKNVRTVLNIGEMLFQASGRFILGRSFIIIHSFVAIHSPVQSLIMNKRILNVDNGPGSNGLRGGIKQYSPQVTTGPWLDTYGGPLGYKRGFTTSDFQTEAQHAQLGVIKRPPGPFGAGIKVVDERDSRGNKLSALGTETWVSNTKATHPNFGVIRKVNITHPLANVSRYFT